MLSQRCLFINPEQVSSHILMFPGYAIFLVLGDLMECEADQILSIQPAVQPIKPRLISDSQRASSSSGGFSQRDLARALEESRQMVEDQDQSLQNVLRKSEGNTDQDDDLQRALALSLQGD